MFRLYNQAPGAGISYQPVNSFDWKVLDDNDKLMFKYLVNLYRALNDSYFDFDKVKNVLDALKEFDEREKINYLDYLLHPEANKGCKIPSAIPVPSTAFQMHNTISLTTNNKGNLAFIFNPFFLANADSKVEIQRDGFTYTSDYLSTFWYNNDNSLDGSSASDFFKSANLGQTIPPVYSSYRIVSGSIIVKYIGRMDIASGVVGGSIIYDDKLRVGGSLTNSTEPTVHLNLFNPELAKYGNFDLAMDSFYHVENLSIEGTREIYFPIDPSFEDYTVLYNKNSAYETDELGRFAGKIESMPNDYKKGFNFFFYALGCPAESTCFKIDIYVNYECLPDAKFLNYMPTATMSNNITPGDKNKMIQIAQRKPITKVNEFTPTPSGSSFWDKVKKKLGNIVGGIKTISDSGLVDAVIPGFKTGISIANSLLNDSNVETSTQSSSNAGPAPPANMETD